MKVDQPVVGTYLYEQIVEFFSWKLGMPREWCKNSYREVDWGVKRQKEKRRKIYFSAKEG